MSKFFELYKNDESARIKREYEYCRRIYKVAIQCILVWRWGMLYVMLFVVYSFLFVFKSKSRYTNGNNQCNRFCFKQEFELEKELIEQYEKDGSDRKTEF